MAVDSTHGLDRFSGSLIAARVKILSCKEDLFIAEGMSSLVTSVADRYRPGMRLSKLKLSGFKSFVDPTTVQFPSDLIGIIGPNGCGKSNVISMRYAG